jgi:hypothetical protein
VKAFVGRPPGITALSLFFAFGTTMSGLAALSLIPGSALEPIWRLNPRGHEGLRALGPLAIVLMASVSLVCLAAAFGLWLGRRWGWWMAIAILTINATGDLIEAMVTREWKTLIGPPIAGAIIYYLRTERVRHFFAGG